MNQFLSKRRFEAKMSAPNNAGDGKNRIDILELILQKNTRTIQQEGHRRILDVGSEAMSALETPRLEPDNLSTWLAVEEALTRADQVHKCQMKLALKQLRQEMEEDQALQLLQQQQDYQTMADREMDIFFKNMEIGLKRLDKDLEKQLSYDLDHAVVEFDVGRRSAVRQTTTQVKRRLRNEFALERERKIADNLRVARERFREKTLKIVRYVEEQSKKETMEILEQKTKDHQQTMDHLKDRMKTVTSEIMRLQESGFRLNLAFKELSAEYQKLLSRVEADNESVCSKIPIENSTDLVANKSITSSRN